MPNERSHVVRYLRRVATTTMDNLPKLAQSLGTSEARLQHNAATLLAAAEDIEEGKHVLDAN